MPRVRILDLYCGMGGLSLGFLLALEDAEIRGLDIDRWAVSTYNFNLNSLGGEAEVVDVLKWRPAGRYDVVVGGPPCQPFSVANTKRRGKDHPLYPTFSRFFDVVLELEPVVFLMENVKGLVSQRHMRLMDEQLARIKDLYSVTYRVLDASRYGVPQRRQRLFVLGIRRDLGIVPSFPPPTHAERETATLFGRLYRWVTVKEAIGDLLAVPPLKYPKKLVQTNPRHGKPLDMEKPSRTVKVDGRGGDFTFDTMLVPLTLREHVMTEKGGWTTPRSDWGSRIIREDRPSYTITEKHRSGQLIRIPDEHVVTGYVDPARQFKGRWAVKHPVLDSSKPSPVVTGHVGKNVSRNELAVKMPSAHGDSGLYRRLTVRECLRLQSFPDWWGFPEGVSISRKYRLVGEAVPPILAYRLAVHLAKLLGWRTREPPREEEWQLPYFRRAFQDYFS